MQVFEKSVNMMKKYLVYLFCLFILFIYTKISFVLHSNYIYLLITYNNNFILFNNKIIKN